MKNNYKKIIKLDIKKDSVLDEETILQLINYHKTTVFSKLENLKEYYEGEHDILNSSSSNGRPNNKIINNFPSYIVDIHAGYFLGNRINYHCDHKKTIEKIIETNDFNVEHAHNQLLAKEVGIFGYSYELLTIEDKKIIYNQIDPTEIIAIYDANSIKDKIVGAIRYVEQENICTNETNKIVEYFNDKYVFKFSYNENTLKFIKKYKHGFNSIPIIEYRNNSKRIGDFENEIPLIDSYNKLISSDMNETDYINDAYLVFYGVSGLEASDPDSEDLEAQEIDARNQLKDNKALFLPDSDSKAEWLLKNLDDTQRQNLRNQLVENIHKFSCTPDLSDKNFSQNASGISMQYKVYAMSQKAVNKENEFRKSINQRNKLIVDYYNLKEESVINLKFTRNTPLDIQYVGDAISKMIGIASRRTVLSFIPGLDVDMELEEIEKEKAQDDPDSEWAFNKGIELSEANRNKEIEVEKLNEDDEEIEN